MKKILSFVIVLSFVLSACSSADDSVFDQGPDERLQATLDQFQDALLDAPDGWLVAVGTASTASTTGGAYRFYIQFNIFDNSTDNNENRVRMISDQNATTVLYSNMQESSYRLKAMQYPTLMFDTYNYIHALSNPAINSGKGYQSDFDFELVSLSNEDGEIVCIGRYNSCPIIMTRATPSEKYNLTTTGASNFLITAPATMTAYFAGKSPFVNVEGFEIKLTMSNKRQSYFTYKDEAENTIRVRTASYVESNQTVRFMTPFSYNGITFDRMIWNEGLSKYYIPIDGVDYEVEY